MNSESLVDSDGTMVDSTADPMADSMADTEESIEDPRVVAAVERLADIDGLPVAEQVAIFADVHTRLTEALGTETADGSTSTVVSSPHDVDV